MRTLSQAVLETLAYLDVFDFAPTLLDVERWLLHTDESHTLSDIKHVLETHPHIHQAEGFYFLEGRQGLNNIRKQKYSWTEQKWKHTHRYIRLIAAMPYVEGVWLANSMGWENARKESDIDLLIVTTPGHIWTARFFTTGLMKLLRQRPQQQRPDRALCLSLYISADQLDLSPYKLASQDIHYVFWATQFYPLYDVGHYRTFQQQNLWLGETLNTLHWLEPIGRRYIVLTAPERLIKKILTFFCNEKILKHIQLSIMPQRLKALANTDQRVVLSDHILKLHTNDTRHERQVEWERRCAELQHL